MTEEVIIESLGAQGDGVTADGLYVPGTLPGERVQVSRQGHRAQVHKIVHEATDRTLPPCQHFGPCGGCALQHASDGLVAGWKQDLVFRALAARGFTEVEIAPVQTSPPASRRRVVFSGRRTRKGVTVGLHGPASDTIVAVPQCRVARPEILGALPALARIVEAGASRKGELKLAVTASRGGLDVAVTGGKEVEGALYGELVAIAATEDLARLAWNGEALVTRRAPGHAMGRAHVVPPPGAFLQATREGEAVLVAAARKALAGARRVADLFAGSGTFTLPLAETAEVHAVEQDADALAALDHGWRHAEGLRRVTTEARDLFHRPLRVQELDAYDAALFDPPRAGARAQAEQLALSRLARIVAVSCNPATFARDARTLVDGGYRLDWVLPVDQFRWSPHVELVAAFTRG